MTAALLLSGCLFSLPPSAGAVPPAPQEAFTVSDQVPVRSGPGPQFYATDHLQRGQRVEVYRRDAGGWLAIRPPVGSFSLVPTRQLQITTNPRVARITAPNAVSWVATRHGPVANYKWQVKLEVGELVAVVGQQNAALFEGADAEPQTKITPPAGEFRWVHEDFVAAAPRPTTSPVANSADGNAVDLTDVSLMVETSPSATNQPNDGRWRASTPSVANAQPQPGNRTAAATNNVQVASAVQLPADQPSTRNGGSKETFGLPGLENDQLSQLNLLLSAMVARPTEQWDLSSLRSEAMALIDSGTTALDRGQARLLLERITEFAELQSRQQQVRTSAVAARPAAFPSASGPTPIASGNVAPPAVTPSNQVVAAGYDGQGVLVPVHSRSRKAPPYALVDANGQVLKYVSPSPGVNLHRYLGKSIGIIGQRGYLPTLEANHVTAHRIVRLDRHVR